MDIGTLSTLFSYAMVLISIIGVWTWIIVNAWASARYNYTTGYQTGHAAGAAEVESAVRREVESAVARRTAKLDELVAPAANGTSPELRADLRKTPGAA